MIDITKPLQTVSGVPVEIISNKYRHPSLKIVGYSGSNTNMTYWDIHGKHTSEPNLNLEYVPEYLYLNVYNNDSVGVFNTEEAAKASPKTPAATIKIKCIPGQKDF